MRVVHQKNNLQDLLHARPHATYFTAYLVSIAGQALRHDTENDVQSEGVATAVGDRVSGEDDVPSARGG